MRSRLLGTLLATNVVLLVVVIGWLTWITLEPRYWFAGAYAEQGIRGERGPRGDRGPVGPAGPVGPDAFDAYNDLETDLSDLSGGVDALTSRVDEVETSLSARDDLTLDTDDDAEKRLKEICSAISTAYIGANSATEDLLFELQLACP